MPILLLLPFFLSVSIKGMDAYQPSVVSSSSSSAASSDTTTYVPTNLTLTTETKEFKNQKWVKSNDLVWSLLIARQNKDDKSFNPGELYDALIQRCDSNTLKSYPVAVYCAREGEIVKMICPVDCIYTRERIVYETFAPVLIKSALPYKRMFLVYGTALWVDNQQISLNGNIVQRSPFRYKPLSYEQQKK